VIGKELVFLNEPAVKNITAIYMNKNIFSMGIDPLETIKKNKI
jgi:hypothetical protein